MANLAIGRDYYLGMSTSPRSYYVKLGGNTIFNGKAYTRPGDAQPFVRVNDIAAPYLKQAWPGGNFPGEGGSAYVPQGDISRTFKVYDASTNSQIGNDLDFCYDWSGDAATPPTALGNAGPHRPIKALAFKDMPLILTLYNNAPLTAIGDTGVEVQTTTTSPAVVLSYGGVGNYLLEQSSDYIADSDKYIRWGCLRFDLVPACAIEKVLYYVNAYGAWDCLAMEGRCSEGYDYERHTLRQVYNNTNPVAAGEVNYANGYRRKWTLRTGWIDELGASRMHHLVGTTLAVLLDVASNTYTPVTIQDTELLVRDYKSEGAPVQYAINVQEAREGTRR